jgi:hypothetical protein
MKKQIVFLIVILLTACTPQRGPNAEEQLATIAVKTQVAGQLGTIVAQTLTANPPTFTPIPTQTPTITPTVVPSMVTDLLACGPAYGLVYFKIDPANTYRNWEGMIIGMNTKRVICSEVPGDPNTLTCEMPPEIILPATISFGVGGGIIGNFTFSEEQCAAVGFPPELAVLYTVTTAQNVNLRANPGLLFPVSRVMAQGTRLQVRVLSPGRDWAYVQNIEGVNGWVDLTFVKQFPKAQLGENEPTGVREIKGSVVNANGTPMYHINFAITQGNKRTEAKTNKRGEFHAYLPASASGTWTVSFISFDTEGNALTPECLLDTNACGKTTPLSVEVTLPTSGPILFGWE